MDPYAWKIMPEIFFLDWWQFAKIWILLILPKSDQSTIFLKIMIFHAYGSIYLTLLNEKNWPKFGQVWPNFDQILGSNFLSFHPKMGFGKMHWFPKYEIFLSNSSKVIALGDLEPPKANFSITLRPLKLQISEKVLRPMKFRSKALVLTYPKPFGMKVGGSQVFSTDSTRIPIPILRKASYQYQ